MRDKLWRQWWRLMASRQVIEAVAHQEFEQLVQAYGSRERRYHTLVHIQQVLATVEQLKHYARYLEIVELAAWFHDVVYDPQASDNEANSADYAMAAIGRLGLPEAWLSPVQQLILATGSHLADAPATNAPDANYWAPDRSRDSDIQVLLDADLAILGSPPRQYAAYARAIRQEYAWVSDDRYRQGRSQILQAFLQRPKLYFTPPMQALAAQAHTNLHTEIQRLNSPRS
jgi:predicted metal-dependent HD superfamily phosphohydrolase